MPAGSRRNSRQGCRRSDAAARAAHIEPWSVGHDDDSTNGLGLCKLCHWGFDYGMLAVSERYTVMTSKRLAGGENLGWHLVTVAGRGILLPEVEELHPSREKVAWHRRELFAG